MSSNTLGLTFNQVENAFQPSKEIDNSAKFVGRIEKVKESYLGLISAGSHLAVIGNRGIGKTSLARQIEHISQGKNDLLEKLKIDFDKDLDFFTVYYACGNAISDISDLLTKLLSSKNCFEEWIYDIQQSSTTSTAISPKIGLSALGVKAGVDGENKTEVLSEPAITSHDVETIFTNTMKELLKRNLTKDGILIILDEFDQIKNPSGFASFLKAISTNVPKVKFCLVGVAQDLQNLIKEHQSSDRLFAGSIISLPSMTASELKGIIKIAEEFVNSKITFTEEASNKLVNLAQGHPYMVHLIGKYAFRFAFEKSNHLIQPSDIDHTVKSIAERGYDPVLEGRYKKAVQSSEQREIVLKSLAEVKKENGEVFTSEAYRIAENQGVENSSHYVGQLVTEDFGAEILRERERFYRFKDSLFATYVNARPYMLKKQPANKEIVNIINKFLDTPLN